MPLFDKEQNDPTICPSATNIQEALLKACLSFRCLQVCVNEPTKGWNKRETLHYRFFIPGPNHRFHKFAMHHFLVCWKTLALYMPFLCNAWLYVRIKQALLGCAFCCIALCFSAFPTGRVQHLGSLHLCEIAFNWKIALFTSIMYVYFHSI